MPSCGSWRSTVCSVSRRFSRRPLRLRIMAEAYGTCRSMSATISGRKANRSRRCAAVEASRALSASAESGTAEGYSGAPPGATYHPVVADRRMRSSLLFDLFAANQRVRSLLTAAMDGAGLKPDEYAVYSALFEFEPISPTEIATIVGMPPTTLSHYIRAMRERGHLDERRNPQDSRSRVLTLTVSGRQGAPAGQPGLRAGVPSLHRGHRRRGGGEGGAGADRGRGRGRPDAADQRRSRPNRLTIEPIELNHRASGGYYQLVVCGL